MSIKKRSEDQKENLREILIGLAFVAIVVTTVVLWLNLRKSTEESTKNSFEELAFTQRGMLIDRMKDYEQVLLGAAGLFAASDHVSRAEWRKYIDALHLDQTLPGIQGVGFTKMILPEDKKSHEQSIRQEGYPEYKITPDGQREIYSSIIYLEPFSGRNIRAFGYDMYSEPIRRAAMRRAAATGKPAWTSKVTLVQEDDVKNSQPGFLVYVPIYENQKPILTTKEREAALIGYVYSPFRAWDMMGKLFQDTNRLFELQLFAGSPQKENLLYETAPLNSQAIFKIDLPVLIGGTEWTARFWGGPNLNLKERLNDQLIRYSAVVGMECLLFMAFVIDSRYRRREHKAKQELENANREIGLIASLMQQLQGCNEEKQIFTLLKKIMGELFPGTNGGFYMLNTQGTELSCMGVWGNPLSIPGMFKSHSCFAIQECQMRCVSHSSKSDARCDHAASSQKSYICMPLLNRGQRIGSIYLEAASEEDFSESLIKHYTKLLTSVADTISLTVSNLRLKDSLKDLSIRDPLTGLYNRRYMEEGLEREIDRARRIGRSIAVVLLDVDHFKKINDQYGHEAGDIVLKHVADLMKDFRSGSDIVCRFGGEEFVLILPDMSPQNLSDRMNTLKHNIEKMKITYRGEQLPVTTASIGIACFPEDGMDRDALLRSADLAMYRAKQNGRNRIEWSNAGA